MFDHYDPPITHGIGLARRSDPPESKQAAREIALHLPRLQGEVLKMVAWYPTRTVSELAEIYNERDPRKIGRRISELVAAGKVYKSDSRRCSVTGKTAGVWRTVVK
jgi:hypothetical protein